MKRSNYKCKAIKGIKQKEEDKNCTCFLNWCYEVRINIVKKVLKNLIPQQRESKDY